MYALSRSVTKRGRKGGFAIDQLRSNDSSRIVQFGDERNRRLSTSSTLIESFRVALAYRRKDLGRFSRFIKIHRLAHSCRRRRRAYSRTINLRLGSRMAMFSARHVAATFAPATRTEGNGSVTNCSLVRITDIPIRGYPRRLFLFVPFVRADESSVDSRSDY